MNLRNSLLAGCVFVLATNVSLAGSYSITHADINGNLGSENFGTVGVGNSATVTLTFSNGETVDTLDNCGASIWPDIDPPFSVVEPLTCGDWSDDNPDPYSVDLQVNDGNSCTVTIRYAPSSSGVHSDTFYLYCNDSSYNGNTRPSFNISLSGTGTVTPGISVSAISGNTTEAGGTATFTVVLDTQPTADVTIGLSSSDTTEGTVSPASLTFTNANWNTPQTVTVTGVDDSLADGSVSFNIVTAAATSADGNYNGMNAGDVTVTNADDDVAGITVSTISGNTTEAGGTATFTVVLNTQPTADVIIGLSSSDASEGSVSPTSLTFTTANWNQDQTVTVTGVDDSDVDGNVSFSVVTASSTSADSNYNGLNPSDVNVTNIDDDVAGTDSNGDGIDDDAAAAIGLQPDDTDADTDGDGVSDSVEVGDPNNPTDTDGDGLIDALEPGNASNDATVLAMFITSDTAQALNLDDMANTVLTIRSNGAGTLVAHPNGSRYIPLFSETDLPTADNNYNYPFGLVDYSVTAPGGTASIVIQLPMSAAIPDNAIVRKLDGNNRWRTIGATVDQSARTITLELDDNDIFDRNSSVNIIRDPVGIAVAASNGGGGCTLSEVSSKDIGMALLLGILIVLGSWHRSIRKID